jgi:serine/threonine-protein kinase
MEQTIYAATQPAPAIESVAPWVSREVAEIVNRALAFDRGARWPTAQAMRAALVSVIAPAHVEAPAGQVRPRSSATATMDMPAVHSVAGVPTLVHGSVTPAAPESAPWAPPGAGRDGKTAS